MRRGFSHLALKLVVEHVHHAVELGPGDLAITVVVNLVEGVSDLNVRGSLVRWDVLVDVVGELVQVDVAVTVGINVLEDEGGPLRGALDEVGDLVLGDATIAVGVNNIEEGGELRVSNDLALHASGILELVLGDLAVTVGVEDKEHLVDLSLSLVRDEGLEVTEDVGIEERSELLNVGVGDILIIGLSEGGEADYIVGVVVDNGVV